MKVENSEKAVLLINEQVKLEKSIRDLQQLYCDFISYEDCYNCKGFTITKDAAHGWYNFPVTVREGIIIAYILVELNKKRIIQILKELENL